MDKFLPAKKTKTNYCVTVSVEGVEFIQPVEVRIGIMASINYVGRTSMIVGIHIDSMNPKTGETNCTQTLISTNC